MRDFLAWADLQSSEGARVVETVLPETDDDAVRILTIHGAKGLEFPITIVSGMTTRPSGRPPQRAAPVPARRRHVRAARVGARHHRGVRAVRADRRADGLPREAPAPLRRADARPRPPRGVGAPAREGAAPTTARRGPTPSWCGTPRPSSRAGSPSSPAPTISVRWHAPTSTPRSRPRPPPWDDWVARARPRPHRIGAPRGCSPATAMAREAEAARAAGRPRRPTPGLAKGPRDLELPPWNKGRYGTALGRAVHAVLQTVDLATGAGLDDAAAAQAAAEGIIGKRGRRRRACPRRARRRASVQEAVAHGFRREMYVATPVDGITLEGYVDLVYRTARRSGRRRLQDRRVVRRRRPRRQGRALPAPGRVVRGRARTGDGRAGRRVRLRVPRRPRRRRRACGQRSSGGDA